MEAYQSLFDNIGRYVSQTKAEQVELGTIIQNTKIKKRRFIDQPRYVICITITPLRVLFVPIFLTIMRVKEYTVQITIEDWLAANIQNNCCQIERSRERTF